jgi:hypothetical protein
MPRANFKTHIELLLLFLCAITPGLAQDRGTIRGIVTDPSGAAVPGAQVTVRNVNTGLTQIANTGADGVYSIPYLPVGIYNVSTEKTGFRTAETSNIRVDVNTVIDVNIPLTVGAIDQKVEVSAQAILLETQGTNLGKTLQTKAIMDLPLFLTGGLRSNMSFIILTPGVIGSSGNPRIAAGLENGQSEQLDGAEAQSERRNDAALSGISVEAVEEFKVQSGAYSAEYGRSSNGVINWVTKSGTNGLHGSGFVFARNEFFNARGFTFTATERPVVRQWNPGGSMGGPVYIPKVINGKNKLFFFFAFERAQTRNGRSTSLVTVPIQDFRNGDFRKYVDSKGNMIPLYDPFDAAGNIIQDPTQRPRLQCNGVLNVICPDRIDPRAKAVESILPQPDNPNLITNNTRSYARSTSLSWVPSWKGDYVISDKSRVSFMYGYQMNPAQPCISSIQNVPCNTWPTTSKIQYYRFNHDYILRPNLLNHFTLGFNKRNYIENPDNINNVDDAWRQAIQIPGTLKGGKSGKATEYDTQYVSYATRVDTDSRTRTTNFKEQLAWMKGKHSVKFGMDYLRSVYRRIDCVGCAGQLGFSNVATSNPAVAGQSGTADASFLLGLVSAGNLSYGADAAYHWPYYAWYVQDDFKVSSKLTINIGLRYDLIVPKEERHHYNSDLCLTCPNPAAGNLPGAMIFAGQNGAPNRFGDTRSNGLGPRLGIAYRIAPKTVIRTGGAIYYQPTREDRNADDGIQGFGGWFYSTADYLGLGISMNLKDGFNIYSQQVQANKPPVTSPAVQLYGTPYFYSSQAGRAPYFTDFNFTIEQGIGNTSVLRVSYHGNVGNKLLSRKQTLNQLDPKYLSIYGSLLGQSLATLFNNPASKAALDANGFKLPYAGYPMNRTLSAALRPFPQYDNIDGSGGGLNDGHLTYHALETSFEHRFASGLYMMASYTFCKTLSTVDSEYQYAGFGPAQNQYNRSLDKSVSFEDTPHNLRISYVYELPVGKGKRWLGGAHPAVNAVLGNWRVSAIHTYVSGRPLIFRASQQMYGATGIEPVTDGSIIAGALSTRASIVPGAGVSIPLLNPAWSSGKNVAFGVPELNTAAFYQPPSGQYGNLPPTLPWIRQPWTINEDVAILKNFNFTEKKYVELRAGASNALNRALLAAPDVNVNSPTFGKITQPQGNSPRSIQLGMKFYF